jgi:hypothetical protein
MSDTHLESIEQWVESTRGFLFNSGGEESPPVTPAVLADVEWLIGRVRAMADQPAVADLEEFLEAARASDLPPAKKSEWERAVTDRLRAEVGRLAGQFADCREAFDALKVLFGIRTRQYRAALCGTVRDTKTEGDFIAVAARLEKAEVRLLAAAPDELSRRRQAMADIYNLAADCLDRGGERATDALERIRELADDLTTNGDTSK